jgi:hypothetical protein
MREASAPDSLRAAIAPDCPGDSQQWLSAVAQSLRVAGARWQESLGGFQDALPSLFPHLPPQAAQESHLSSYPQVPSIPQKTGQ